jgi:glycosyltransferase involved in cell wall biosynthesis
MEVRDLRPESLVAVGASEHRSPLVRGLETLARRLYRSAQHVVTVTEAQRSSILGTGIPAERVTVIPNGVDEEFLHGAASPAKRSNGDQFVVTYIGTLGMAHHLETLLEAAQLIRRRNGVCFRLVGEGAQRTALEAKARALGLDNVEFAGEQPRHSVPRWIAESDVCVVLLRKTQVFRTVVPSKMLEVMAVGRPIVLGVEGEARTLLERAGAGMAIEPENATQLADAIECLRNDAAARERLGHNGREFVQREFLRSQLAVRYLEVLQGLTGQPVGAPLTEPCTEATSVSGEP